MITTIVYIVIGLLGLAGIIAAGQVVIRSSATKQARDLWRDESEAQKARADRLDAQVTDLLAEVAKLNARLQTVESDNANLREMVTGHREIEELTKLVQHQHGELMATVLTLKAAEHDGT